MGGGIGIDRGPLVTNATELAGMGEARERGAESLVADVELGTQLGASEGRRGESGEDSAVESVVLGWVVVGRWWGVGGIDELEMHVVIGTESEPERVWGGCAAMLDGEQELALVASHVEQRVGPGEEVARAAQAVAGLPAGAVLAGVVHDEDGEIVGPGKLAQIAEQRRDLSGVVLVDAMKPHERIEDEQPRSILGNRVAQAPLIAFAIETERRSGDQVDGQRRKVETAVLADATQTGFHHGRRIFGHVEQHAARVAHFEGAETWRAAGDGESHLEGEP